MRKKITLAAIVVISLLFIGIVVEIGKISPFLFQLFFDKGITLKKENERVNILGLGIGGGNHQGPNLSDTIIFASLDLKNNKVTMVSIPRDLWIPDLSAKINTAYAYGEEKKEGDGFILSKAIVSKILDQPIDYVFRIDFDGFIRAVDLIGGLDIEVERTFDDFEYPIEGKENDPCGHKEEELEALATTSSQLEAFPCRFKTLHFDKGPTHLDGKTALDFVRSRYAKGVEGTDFARSKRQEKIIAAFKDKIFSPNTFLNPIKMAGLYSTLNQNIASNLKQSEVDDFIRLVEKMRGAKIESSVLDFGDSEQNRPGLLSNPPISKEYKGQWVLIPGKGNGDFSEIQKYVDCQIKTGNCLIVP